MEELHQNVGQVHEQRNEHYYDHFIEREGEVEKENDDKEGEPEKEDDDKEGEKEDKETVDGKDEGNEDTTSKTASQCSSRLGSRKRKYAEQSVDYPEQSMDYFK